MQRIENISSRNSPFKLDAYDFNEELIQNLLLSIIYGKYVPGSAISSGRVMDYLNGLYQAFTPEQMQLTMHDGIQYFTHQSRLKSFWEQKCSPLSMIDALQFKKFVVGSIFLDRFVRVFNGQQLLIVMNNIIFNYRRNDYICTKTNDLQILQCTIDDFFLVHYRTDDSSTPETKVVNVFGFVSVEKYQEFAI